MTNQHWREPVATQPAKKPFQTEKLNDSGEEKMTEQASRTYGWNASMPVSLHEKLKIDLKEAMRRQDAPGRDAIRIIMSEYPKLTVPITLESGKKSTRLKKPEEITNDDVLGIIRGLIKSEKMTLELQHQESSEYLEILSSYLPQPATEEEINAWIDGNIDFSQFKTPTQAMGPIMKHFGQRADGNLVKRILQQRAG